MCTILHCKNGNLPVIGILIACLVELVDKYISMISKHCPQQLFPGKPIHQTNVNEWWAGPTTECKVEWSSASHRYKSDIGCLLQCSKPQYIQLVWMFCVINIYSLLPYVHLQPMQISLSAMLNKHIHVKQLENCVTVTLVLVKMPSTIFLKRSICPVYRKSDYVGICVLLLTYMVINLRWLNKPFVRIIHFALSSRFAEEHCPSCIFVSFHDTAHGPTSAYTIYIFCIVHIQPLCAVLL